mgnify:CR=1 FL=1
MDPITILAAIAPLLVEGGKAAINRWLTPDTFKPANISDVIALKNADIELFKALNAAGGSGTTYQWVEAIVRLMRPLVATAVLFTWTYIHLSVAAEADTATVDNFASAIAFYLFGDRTLFYSKKIGSK